MKLPKNAVLRTLLALSITGFLGACSSVPTASVDHDPSFDFSQVREIAVLPLNRSITSPTAVSDMEAGRIVESLSGALLERGMQMASDVEQADMLLTWHLVTQERTDIRTYNSMSAHYTRCWSCPTSSSQNVRVRQYTQGTIIVDLLDPGTGRSVWRSIFESRLRSNMSQEDAEELRQTASRALFAEFPPL
ncbi:MAG: DUF4136 domain-containing protein [Halioglobus sp.]